MQQFYFVRNLLRKSLKKAILTYCLLVAILFAAAQKQANTWYFGNKIGLDFNQSPPKVLNNGSLTSLEGCATISDINGKLLFYTNGLSLANRKHTLMMNGDNLMGSLTSTSNALIVPLPSNDSIYYVFTIGAQNENAKGLRYSIVNMNGDGGYGAVIQKNILIEDQTFEKLAAVKHCNKRDVWITVHKGNSDEYHTYLITPAGISATPVISNTGYTPVNPIGVLKFAPDGSKLVSVFSFETNTVELMNFDNTTGALTAAVNFQPETVAITDELFIEAYGAEFSPNSRLLYISSNVSDAAPSKLFQFDISVNNGAAIFASEQLISQNDPWFAGGLQMGPDHKIYMSLYKDNYISVIENPDVPGPGCNFMYDKIFMGAGSPVQFGLPGFIQSYFNPASNPYDFQRSGDCSDLDVPFTINRLTGIDSVKWDFGDLQNSTSLAPVHHYAAPGYYDVNLTVYKVDCSGTNDIINRKIWVSPVDFLGKDTGTCANPSIQIGVAAITGANYTWNNGAETNTIMANDFGQYWLTIDQNGCSITDTINFIEKAKSVVNLGKDTTVCALKPITLKTGNPSATSYLWSTGETGSSITVNTAGIYSVEVTDNSCTVSDTVKLSWGDCGVYIPNAFMPSGKNNLFGVVGGFASFGFYMQVFDRWGNIVFVSGNPTQKWDGTYKGKVVPQGAYTWTLAYVDKNGHKEFLQGSVMLIR